MDRPPPRTTIDPVISVTPSHASAEATVKALARAGFDMRKLSVIGKGYLAEERPVGFYSTGDRISTWGGIGGFWGAIWGLLAPALFYIPQVGLVAAGGPIGLAIVGALEGAVIVSGASALAAALVGLGLPRDAAIRYDAEIRANRFLVIVHGQLADVARARGIVDAMSAPENLPEAVAH